MIKVGKNKRFKKLNFNRSTEIEEKHCGKDHDHLRVVKVIVMVKMLVVVKVLVVVVVEKENVGDEAVI